MMRTPGIEERVMTVARIAGLDDTDRAYEVRTIRAADLREALRRGWADFVERRGDLIFVGIIYPLVGFMAAIMTLQDSLIPLFFPVAAGIALLGPVAAAGFYELARRREHGLDSDWSHFLDVIKRPSFDSLMIVTGLLLVLFFAWLAVAAGLYLTLMGTAPESFAVFLRRLFTTPEGWALIVLGNLAGLIFATAVLTVSVVSMPMLVDKDVDVRVAIGTSESCCAGGSPSRPCWPWGRFPSSSGWRWCCRYSAMRRGTCTRSWWSADACFQEVRLASSRTGASKASPINLS
jgi:uncharacterized membrane protein